MPLPTAAWPGGLKHRSIKPQQPFAGRPILHRLNRAEYANAIRDLLALDIDAASLLPPDDSAFGFDNISDALGVSPSLQEHYLDAALKIGALAVGDPNIAAGQRNLANPAGSFAGPARQWHAARNRRRNAGPLQFSAGWRVFFQAKLYRTNLNIMRGLESPHQVEFAVDGRRIHLASIGGADDLASLFEKPTDTGDAVDARLRVRVPVKAGPHVVTVAFLKIPMPWSPPVCSLTSAARSTISIGRARRTCSR